MIHKMYIHLLFEFDRTAKRRELQLQSSGPKKRQPSSAAAGSEGLTYNSRGGGLAFICIHCYVYVVNTMPTFILMLIRG